LAGPVDSIAVLPFQNKSADSDSDYLSDGLSESLIYRLSQLPNLKVSPTSLVFRYKGKEIDSIKVGTDLGVSAVLTGRITQRGDDLTISAELVMCATANCFGVSSMIGRRRISGNPTRNCERDRRPIKATGFDRRERTRQTLHGNNEA
jgi:TolB-like protein